MRIFLLFVSLFAFGFTASAADAPLTDGKTKKIVISTSAQCGMCKASIEKALYALDGVKKAELDEVTKKVKIKYDESLVDAATLRQAISAVGYDADDVPARKKAYEALANCCKKKNTACCASEAKSCKKGTE